MKFTLSILALLAIAFLVGCSARDTSGNDIGKAELTELSKKYSGTYVFSRKFESEIKQRERERRAYELSVLDRVKSDEEMRVELRGFDQKFPQTLSNGKQYYLRSNYRGKVVIPEEVSLKIKNHIGEKAYKHCSIVIEEFYIDDNERLQVISLSLMFYVGYTKFGLFGDEGRGFSLSRDRFEYYEVKNKFYMEDLEK